MQSQGFCLLNNVAIGAAHAMNQYNSKIKKVAIIDFDVHHGNGTEACVRNVATGGRDGIGFDYYNINNMISRSY